MPTAAVVAAALSGSAVVAAPAPEATAAAPPTAVAPAAPALPTVTPVAPTPPPVSGMPPAFAAQFDTPTAQTLATHRIRDGVGGIVRTLVVAALVAGAVFAGRYAWDWNEDRHSDAAAAEVLPAASVAALDARFVAFRGGDGSPVTAHVDLATGDYVVSVVDVNDLARRGDEYWMRSAADGEWVPASAELLDSAADARATIAEASLVMISDVLPVETHPYVTVTADETVVLSGQTMEGPQVIEISELEARPTAVDPEVLVRHLTVTIDRLALRTDDPNLARSSGLDGTSPLVIDIWVDRTGVVRKMSTPAGTSGLPDEYELISASSDGLGPLADLGLPAPFSVVPPQEVGE